VNRATYFAHQKEFSKERRTQNFFFYQNVSIDIAIIVLIYILGSSSKFYLHLMVAPLVCSLMFRAFSLMHEAVHGVLHTNNEINKSAGLVYGAICGLPFFGWKKSHLLHHFWSGNLDKDPVMAFLRIYPRLPPIVKSVLNCSWKLWVPILAVIQNLIFWTLCVRAAKREADVASLFLMVGIGTLWSMVLLNFPSSVVFFGWLPGLYGYFLLTEIVNFPHHLQLVGSYGEKHFPFWEQDATARSCLYPKWISSYLTLNFNYHAEHHLFPNLPYWELPKIHDLIKSDRSSLRIDQNFEWIKSNRTSNLQFVLKCESPPQGSTAVGFY